jgi:hypothetical protein
VKLFHGSNMEISCIDLEKCRPFKDFGKGFYTTPFQNQAWTMARRSVKIYGNGTPWITEFFFDENILKDDKHGTLNITALINTFLSGIISEDALRRELIFRELSMQYSFHTERAVVLLRKTGAYYE